MPKYDLSNKYKAQLATEKLNDLINKGKWIELKELKMPRSLDSNRLYWLWLGCIETETGIDRNELHLMYRAKLLPKDAAKIEIILTPELIRLVNKNVNEFHYFDGLNLVIDIISYSTTELDQSQFTNYLNEIKKHAKVNFGVTLLTLEEQNFQDFYKTYAYK